MYSDANSIILVSLPSVSRNNSASCSETPFPTILSVPPGVASTSSRSPLSSIPSSGWNLTTLTSHQVSGTRSPIVSSPSSETFAKSTTIFSTSCLEQSALGPSVSVLWPPPCSVPVSCSSGTCTIVSTTSTGFSVASITSTASSEPSTTCTDEENNAATSSSNTDTLISIPLMPSLPPPVSPVDSVAKAPTVTLPPQPSVSDAGVEIPLPQLSALLAMLRVPWRYLPQRFLQQILLGQRRYLVLV
ncbi:hypothetical protein F4775DRAFT_561543 [Biscogniauxia sp. FL1348]|nr:hypothetical protein F4775DRAFT_561543 [Biscogniauxia sp. FL1348]